MCYIPLTVQTEALKTRLRELDSHERAIYSRKGDLEIEKTIEDISDFSTSVEVFEHKLVEAHKLFEKRAEALVRYIYKRRTKQC